MADKNTSSAVCLDPGDESGDVIIELPAELLDKLGWSVGDQLVVEKSDDLILLKLKQKASGTVQQEP
ncbi:AbrB/MazE/SpoVT family DNA-binding domain-containing protein [Pseudomonas sp. GLN_6]|uniref:AbrB/MazE/SpoVT family DNA-binding domain-containing protein n=1 Tax=Pseudomonas sp. GLN_6 TaxID=3367183 RepID=UPI00370B33D6